MIKIRIRRLILGFSEDTSQSIELGDALSGRIVGAQARHGRLGCAHVQRFSQFPQCD